MILCCGEALIDMVPLGVPQHSQEVPLPTKGMGFFSYPGGSPYNTALAIGRLGVPVGFLGRLSRDFFGEMLVNHLINNKVNIDLVIRSGEHSTVAFVKLEAGQEPQYVFYTEGTADRSFAPGDLPVKLPEETRCILFGSIAMTMEPVATTIETLILREGGRDRNAPVISMDPNIRSFMILNWEVYRTRFEKWTVASTIVKLSSADLGFIYPDWDLERSLQRLLSLGPPLIVVTLGAAGALSLLQRDNGEVLRVHAPAFHVQVADTIAAGDTFHGAFLVWLELHGKMSPQSLASLTEAELFEALCFANKAAALVCSRPGADPPTLGELETLNNAGILNL